jgi:hypothetical protein
MISRNVQVHLQAPPGASVALGGGLGSFLVHVFIWHQIWRAAPALWRIPTFGPVIVVMQVIALVAAGACRSRRGTISPGRALRPSHRRRPARLVRSVADAGGRPNQAKADAGSPPQASPAVIVTPQPTTMPAT